LPHGLAARYYANADFQGSPEASIEYRLAGATRIDPTIAFAPVGFAWDAKPFPLWFFNDSRRYNFYRPDEPDRRHLPFSVRWDGFIRAPSSEPLAWRLVTEQEATLELFGQPIASTRDGPSKVTIALSPGWHPISLTYVYRGAGPKSLRLEWNDNGPFHPVPSSALMPYHTSPQADRWDGATAGAAQVLFVLQFLAVVWVMASGLWGESKKRFLTERTAVYALVVVMVAFGTLSLGKRGRSPHLNVLNGGDDPLVYETAARQILLDRDPLNRMPSTQPFYFTAGYRYVLATAHALMGPSKAMVVLLQYCFLAIACALLYYLARRLAPPGVALLAAALLFAGQGRGALYRWPTDLFPAVAGILIVAALLLQLTACWERPSWQRAAGAGVLFGLACMVRSNILAFGPIAFLWLALSRALPPRRAAATACAFAIAGALTIAPTTLRNWHVSGEFVLLNKGGSINFWQGNQPPGDLDLSRVGKSPLYRRLGFGHRTQEVLEYARQRPVAFLGGLGSKALLLMGLPPHFSLSLLALHISYLIGASLHWRWGRDRWLAVLLHGFVASQWALLILLKPWPHEPKNQLPTFLVAFAFAALFLASMAVYALGGRSPLSRPGMATTPSPIPRLASGVAAAAFLAAITYTPRLPLLIPLLIWVAWRLRRAPSPLALSP
ncbi:glycosyltransferase family 39 protein, partial [Nitrospinae bacterium AH-259-F20]|nr:glycosyltransferase family 39 protein [Nitrospinae bacterium AH-259-F20]